MFRFAYPEYFQLLWLIPVFLILRTVLIRRGQKRMKAQLSDHVRPLLLSSASQARRRLKLTLELATVFFLVFALARPQMGKSTQEIKSEGIELVFAVDVSRSMLAEDIKPSRLSLAKKTLHRLLDTLSGDKVGLVAFAGSAVLSSPLTNDYSAVRLFLDALSSDSVSTQGTNFKRALEVSFEAFERGGVEVDEVTAVTRAIVVISDGEDNEEGAKDLAKKLKDHGVYIFTLGVGTAKGGPIPLRDDEGELRGYKKSREGEIVNSSFKDGILKQLAQETDGEFFQVTIMGQEVDRIKEDLDRLEKAQFDSEMAVDFDEKFQVVLLMALLLGVFEFVLRERKPAGRIWKGRFEAKGR